MSAYLRSVIFVEGLVTSLNFVSNLMIHENKNMWVPKHVKEGGLKKNWALLLVREIQWRIRRLVFVYMVVIKRMLVLVLEKESLLGSVKGNRVLKWKKGLG